MKNSACSFRLTTIFNEGETIRNAPAMQNRRGGDLIPSPTLPIVPTTFRIRTPTVPNRMTVRHLAPSQGTGGCPRCSIVHVETALRFMAICTKLRNSARMVLPGVSINDTLRVIERNVE
jgi:hypothetical protein